MKQKIGIFFLFIWQLATAQVQFEAKVSKNTLGLNERLQIDFVMNEDGDNFTPPDFEGFRVVAGPFQSVNYSWINGKKTFSKSFSYVLLPTRKGSLTIKGATVEIEEKSYKTNPIKVTVTQAVEQPKDPNNPSYKVGEGVHLVADVSNGNPYVNEPITVVYKLYFDPRFSIRNVREVQNPKYNNFWSQHIDMKQLKAEPTVYNGKDYAVVVWRKVLLYPQKAGQLPLEPLTISMEVDLPTGRRNIFMEPEYTSTSKTVSAGAKTLSVKPLPEAGKPADFTGAVGNFKWTVTPNKTELKSGESLQLKLSVSGKGNLKLFTLPKPVVPASVEMYDPQHTEQVETPLSGMTGSITDTYTLVPQFKGNYPIKPLSFTYFDLTTKTYKTLTAPEITINVTQGAEVAQTDSKTTQPVAEKTAQFQYIKTQTELQNIKTPDFWASTRFYILLILPLLLIPLLIFIRRKKQAQQNDVVGNRIRTTQKLAKKYLSEAYKNLNNNENFYIALEKALHNFLKAKLHIETSDMSKEKISELLQAKKADAQTTNEFLELMTRCDTARYSPLSHNTITHDYQKATEIISQLEKQLK